MATEGGLREDEEDGEEAVVEEVVGMEVVGMEVVALVMETIQSLRHRIAAPVLTMPPVLDLGVQHLRRGGDRAFGQELSAAPQRDTGWGVVVQTPTAVSRSKGDPFLVDKGTMTMGKEVLLRIHHPHSRQLQQVLASGRQGAGS